MAKPLQADTQTRREWMSVLAKGPGARLAELWDESGLETVATTLRAPEIGLVMTRGRAGATGAAFNLGEVTVTRCSVSLDTGAVGHAYVMGRDKRHAEIAATCDALLQGTDAASVEAAIIVPLRDGQVLRRRERTAKAAATKVDFFTMVRGE